VAEHSLAAGAWQRTKMQFGGWGAAGFKKRGLAARTWHKPKLQFGGWGQLGLRSVIWEKS